MEQEIKTSEKSIVDNNKLNINNMILAVVGILIVMSAVQVFQLQGIANAISSGAIKINTQTSGGSAIGLPSQVGGCG